MAGAMGARSALCQAWAALCDAQVAFGQACDEMCGAQDDGPPRSADGAFRCADGDVVLGAQLNAAGVLGDKRPAPQDEILKEPLYLSEDGPPGAAERGIATSMRPRPVFEAFIERGAPAVLEPRPPAVLDAQSETMEPAVLESRPPLRARPEVG